MFALLTFSEPLVLRLPQQGVISAELIPERPDRIRTVEVCRQLLLKTIENYSVLTLQW